MNWLDLIIISVITFFMLVGILRGLVSQVFSALAVFGGLAAGLIFYDVLGKVFTERGIVGSEQVAGVAAFITLALGCYIIIQIAGWVVTKLIGTLKLGLLNRLAGGALGALIGFVAAFLLTSALSLFYTEKDPPFRDSELVPYLNRGYAVVTASMPEDFERSFERARELVREKGLKAATSISDSGALGDMPKDDSPARDEPD